MACLLLIDDEAHVTCVLARRLEAAGHEVLTARDGEEGWQIAQEHLPDLVVTDLQMPYISGLDLARMMREHAPLSETPVIMLTARGYVVDEDQLHQTRVCELHSKPFGVRRLTDRVEAVLEESDIGRERGGGGMREVA